MQWSQAALPPFKPNDGVWVFPDKIKWYWVGSTMKALHSQREKPLELLARTLLFFLPHPLPQLLTDISQRVWFDGQHLNCLAEPDRLHFSTIKGETEQLDKVAAKRCFSIPPNSREERTGRAAYRSLRFCDCFIWLKSVSSVLFTGLKGGDRTKMV